MSFDVGNNGGDEMNVDKFIGIPHHFNESTFDGCDCIGLVRLFYAEHGWSQDFTDDGIALTRDNYMLAPQWRRLFRYLRRNFTEVSDVDYGDVVLFRVNDCEHLGVIIDKYGRLLSMTVPEQEGVTTSTVYHRSMWQNVEHKIWRRRNGNTESNTARQC